MQARPNAGEPGSKDLTRAPPGRTNDPERTKADILEVATHEFSEKGLAAAVEAGKYERQVNRDAAAGQLAELKKAGMQVSEFSAAEQAKLREKFKPVVEKHGAAIAATLIELQAELAKARR